MKVFIFIIIYHIWYQIYTNLKLIISLFLFVTILFHFLISGFLCFSFSFFHIKFNFLFSCSLKICFSLPGIVISFLESQDLNLLVGKLTRTVSILIIPIEWMFCDVLPIIFLWKLLNVLFILIFLMEIKLCSKNNESTKFQTFQ